MSQPNQKKNGPGPKRKTGVDRSPAKKSGAGKRTEKKPGQSPGGQLTTQQKVLRGLYIALVAVSAVIVAVYIFWRLFAAPPDVTNSGIGGVDEVTRPPIITQYVDEQTGELVEVEIPGLPTDRKKEFYTFLLVGQSQDTGGKLSDTMMLVAYDVPNQALSVMSLPRDTYVKYNGRLMLLNAVYNAAGGDKENKGIQGLKRAVKDLTGIYPDFHVIVQWEALGELVDAIGGVYYDVPFDMYYNDLSQHFKIDLKKGYQLLDGEGAMGLVRWRHNSDNSGHISHTYGYAEGDIGRIKTQQAFLKEVIKQCLQMDKLLKNLGDYIDIFQKNVVTDLAVGNIAYFAQSALTGLDMDNVKFETLPWVSAGNAHILPVGSKIVQTVNNGYNPYENDIRLGELKLAVMADVPRPSQTPEPEETADPQSSESPDPVESGGPGESEGPLLPPGSLNRPSSSSRPTESEEPTPSRTPVPSNTPGGPGGLLPPDNERPSQNPEPTPEPTPELPPPPADTSVPVFTPPPVEEEPILPPM